MSTGDIVKVTVFLTDRANVAPNREAREAYLGDLRPAMSLVICELVDPSWLVEIEVVAAR